MRHSWTSFAASLALLCSSMFATAAEPVPSHDAYAAYQQYYQRALQAAPYDLTSPQVTLLLPGEPLLTAALSVAQASDKIVAEISPGVVAQLAQNLEGMPPEPKDEDYNWYASQTESTASVPAATSADASNAEFADNFAYGYEHEYDYGYEDFGYNPHLTSRAPAEEVADKSSEENVAAEESVAVEASVAEESLAAKEFAEPIEDIEHLYGYDADGRPLHTAMSEAVIADESSDYTKGYSVYDDQLVDEYLTKYHELLHGEAFAAEDTSAPSLASQLIEAAQAALAFDWREHALSLAEEALASQAAQELLVEAQVAWQHLNSGESLSAVLDQGNYEYGDFDCDDYECHDDACPSDIAPSHPLVVETEPVSEVPEVAEVNIDALLQIAHTLDRTGIALQEWSLTLSDWACQAEAHRLLQSRRPAETNAR